jgi:signal transduction histidine kinase
VLLGRLRIRGKLALIVALPLLAAALLTVPTIFSTVKTAQRAESVARSLRIAGEVGSLVQEIQESRLFAIGYLHGLVSRSDLNLQVADVTDRYNDLVTALGKDTPAAIAAAVNNLTGLGSLRDAIAAKTVAPAAVIASFNVVLLQLIDSVRLFEGLDVSTADARSVVALDGLLHADEANSASSAVLLEMVASKSTQQAPEYAEAQGALRNAVAEFTTYATPEQADLYGLVAAGYIERTGSSFAAAFDADPQQAIDGLSAESLYNSLNSFIVLGRFVEKKIITDVTVVANARGSSAIRTAYLIGGSVLLTFLVVMLLTAGVARAVARPLTRLTASAGRVARVAEAELERISDDESEAAPVVRLDPIDVGARDEVGDLARAFERVQDTAARLVERQVSSRRNVAQMFGHVGRRTQNLVGRQIALIDRLESEEVDPDRLQHLYRLDHVSSRLRRNASSLVVLSGSTGEDEHTAPLMLADVVRLALGEIEDYTRVDIDAPPDVAVVPAVVGDLVLALAELMENAALFSPPHSRVTVSAKATAAGAMLAIVDHGLGLSEERLAEENARLTRRERLDLAPTEVLGLFVVGRLARRHGLRVALSSTPGGGVTVTIDLARELLAAIRPTAKPVATAPATLTLVPDLPAAPGPATAPVSSPPVSGLPVSGLPVSGAPHEAAGQAAQPPGRAIARAAVVAANSPFDMGALNRVNQTLQTSRSWNAFAPRRQPPSEVGGDRPRNEAPNGTGEVRPRAEPSPEPTAGPAGGEQPAARTVERPAGPVLGRPAAEPAPNGGPPVNGRRAPIPSPLAGQTGLRQRVPGAQLPTDVSPAPPVPPPGPADAAAAQALVEDFEAGVRRALDHSVAPPFMADGAVASPPARPVPSGPPAYPLPASPAASLRLGGPAEQAGTAHPPLRGPATMLGRRVPGATLDPSTSANRPSQPVASQPKDPDEARDLIEQFEEGIARALREVRSTNQHEEGTSR